MMRRLPLSTLFPYTTLFRSRRQPFRPRHRANETEKGGRLQSPLFAREFVYDLNRAEMAIAEHAFDCGAADRKSTRLNSSHANISYAVFCLKKKNKKNTKKCL